MVWLHALPLLPLANALIVDSAVSPPKRVAIIGAGAGGSSTAYHLAQYASSYPSPSNISITVYDRASYVGGRSTTVNAWDDPSHPVELGGSIFVEVNHIMVSAMRHFNLSIASHLNPSSVAASMPDLGIWNGAEFVVVARDEDGWWDKARLLWRYGAAPLWTNRLMKNVVGRFLRMYEEPVFPWRSLSKVVEAVGLLEITGVTGTQYLEKNGIGQLFAREVIQASTRVNYASNLPYIHGVEAMVCMATSGAMSIAGGNWRIFASMLKASHATLHLNTPVTSITRHTHNNTYTLTTANNTQANYDAIILATPLQFSNLSIIPPLPHTPDVIPYTKLHVTLFASPFLLSPTAFNLPSDSTVPQYVLTTLPPDETPGEGVGSVGFYSVSMHYSMLNTRVSPPRREFVYKIFSPGPVDAAFLSHILGHHVPSSSNVDVETEEADAETSSADGIGDGSVISWIHRKIWHAYPREYPRVTFEDVTLDASEDDEGDGEGQGGLYYTSGIESFISTMETSALSGKNVARLVWNEIVGGKTEGFGKEDGKEGRGKGSQEWPGEL